MSKAGHNIRIGTSGWHYEHWGGRFYPERLPKSKWLQHYAKHFDTIEINNTFYQLPKQQTRSVYAYFNNDIDANAVRNAKTPKEQLVRK